MVEMGSSGEAQSWMEGIGKRLRQGWIVIAVATLLATVALLAHVPTGLVLASWILLFFAVLTLPAGHGNRARQASDADTVILKHRSKFGRVGEENIAG